MWILNVAGKKKKQTFLEDLGNEINNILKLR